MPLLLSLQELQGKGDGELWGGGWGLFSSFLGRPEDRESVE